jgi:hypothetical protein
MVIIGYIKVIIKILVIEKALAAVIATKAFLARLTYTPHDHVYGVYDRVILFESKVKEQAHS